MSTNARTSCDPSQMILNALNQHQPRFVEQAGANLQAGMSGKEALKLAMRESIKEAMLYFLLSAMKSIGV